MMLSASSSNSVSQRSLTAFAVSMPRTLSFSSAITSGSPSNSLMEYQRMRSAGRVSAKASSISARAFSTEPWNILFTTGTVFSSAATYASLTSASSPVPFSAEISTTGMPSFFESLAQSIDSPLFFTTSIILTAATTGIDSSVSCVVR
ncbi:hypothetical protein SDC9_118146 [bioreactor metagenome]|uniref:Uncharacterized protein n=1 Tax=bioreactor metagenome TaxID=1076179 RepID=A0A645C787_9ZZZZ